MKMKAVKSVIATVLFTGAIVNIANAGGIPVVDGVHITTDVKNQIQSWALEAERFSERVQQFKTDYENQVKQLSSMTGVRDIAGFLNEAKSVLEQVKDLDKWIGNSQEILSNGKDILSGELRKIFDSYKLTHLCEKGGNLVERKHCEGEIILDVIKQTQNKKKLKTVNQRIKKINQIAKRMETSKDVKETQDLSNAMQTQIALLQSDKMLMDIEKNADELNQRLLDKQKKDEQMKNQKNITQPFK